MAGPARPGEWRLLQAAVVLACLPPLVGGGAGMIFGVENVPGIDPQFRANLDSHFRYLSGLLFGLGLAFLSCVQRLERRSARFRTLGAMVVIGGLARLFSLLTVGTPGPEHLFALGMELGVVPLLLLWQWRLALRSRGEIADAG